MRLILTLLLLVTLGLIVSAQDKPAAGENERLKWDLEKLFKLDESDKAEAKRLGVNAFRILPRETYDGKIPLIGGGAYYAFEPGIQDFNENSLSSDLYKQVKAPGFKMLPPVVEGEHRYTRVQVSPHLYSFGSDLSLENGKFQVGFAGLSYGLLLDLGETPIENVTIGLPQSTFLTSYAPPVKISEIRAEQARSRAYEANGYKYQKSVAASGGHTYLLRSIDFNRSDVLVAFKVHRQDTDGSMIVLWKKLKAFDKPKFEREKTASK
jgi:hypothetical protein